MALTKNSQIDLNGNEMILDADGDTSITADTDDQIDLKVGGTDRAIIDSTGLGVGETSPDSLLHIKGNAPIFTMESNTNSTMYVPVFADLTQKDKVSFSAEDVPYLRCCKFMPSIFCRNIK